jgi:16S rRNA (guanine966-N2)-methyltransferase
LFAGTGVLGFEALSRGAGEAWLVERDPVLVSALNERNASFEASARVIEDDALQVISRTPSEPFDIVFADPPFDMDLVVVLQRLAVWVDQQNLIYVERQAKSGVQPLADMLAALPGARLVKESRAGRVSFGLLRLQT